MSCEYNEGHSIEAQDQTENVTEAQLLACEHPDGADRPLLVVSGRVVGVAFPRILLPQIQLAQAPSCLIRRRLDGIMVW